HLPSQRGPLQDPKIGGQIKLSHWDAIVHVMKYIQELRGNFLFWKTRIILKFQDIQNVDYWETLSPTKIEVWYPDLVLKQSSGQWHKGYVNYYG
ncbi:hypothetical protein L195_g045476, partial [Trifolium pratense]